MVLVYVQNQKVCKISTLQENLKLLDSAGKIIEHGVALNSAKDLKVSASSQDKPDACSHEENHQPCQCLFLLEETWQHDGLHLSEREVCPKWGIHFRKGHSVFEIQASLSTFTTGRVASVTLDGFDKSPSRCITYNRTNF